MNPNIHDILFEYLRNYAEAPTTGRPNPSPDLIQILRIDPKLSFKAIAEVPLPNNLDPRDSGDPAFRLLLTIIDLIPELIIPRLTEGYSGTRSFYIQCAAASKFAIFVPAIIALLSGRSLRIKTLVLSLIVKWPHLRVPEAIPKLERLSKMKSFQADESDRALLEKAKEIVQIDR